MTPWELRCERARQRGVCVRCEEEWHGASPVCRECIVVLVAARDDLRTERQQLGLCRCARATDGKWKLCDRCRRWGRDAMRARRGRTAKPCS